jgi:hypothetical protein
MYRESANVPSDKTRVAIHRGPGAGDVTSHSDRSLVRLSTGWPAELDWPCIGIYSPRSYRTVTRGYTV